VIDIYNHYTIECPSLDVDQNQTVNEGKLIEVTSSSRIEYREAVARFAGYIAAEFEYGFPPFKVDGAVPYRAFLILDPWNQGMLLGKNIPIGACLFRWTAPEKNGFPTESERWWCIWVWLHPFVRRRGILSSLWPYFHQRFGEFGDHLPNEAMQAFHRQAKRKQRGSRGRT